MSGGKGCCGCTGGREQKFQEIIKKYKGKKGALIPVLHEVQELYGYLPLSVQKKVSEGLDIPLSEIYGVITFYTQFSLKPEANIIFRYVWEQHVM